MPKTVELTPALHAYLVAHGTPPDEVQQALIAETQALGDPAGMQIAPEQGALMTLLTRLIGATSAIEIGTFTGYSALCVARGLPPDGRLLCCDVNEEWTAIAQRYWRQAGVDDRIELRLGPALETLQALPREPQFHIAFIDADKPNYLNYVEEIEPRLRPNGLILVDNVLWSGRVVDTDDDDVDEAANADADANADAEAEPDTNLEAIRAFNDAMAGDPRFDIVMAPIADGLTFLRKR